MSEPVKGPVPLALTTPLSQFGLAAAELKQITPAAQKLTKADLISMMEGRPSAAALQLSVKDLNSITQVYVARTKSGAVKGGGGTTTSGGGGCCCCCIACCCCCCAVAVDPEHVEIMA